MTRAVPADALAGSVVAASTPVLGIASDNPA